MDCRRVLPSRAQPKVGPFVMALMLAVSSPLVLSARWQENPAGASGFSVEDRCYNEVIDLHQFFEDWFNGRVPPTEQTFSRVTDALAPEFILISPSGELAERREVIERLREAYGIWRQTSRPGRIWIENVRVRYQVGDQAMVLYQEWQEIDGEVRGRLSTAILRLTESAPNGLEWYHLHEVWLPE